MAAAGTMMSAVSANAQARYRAKIADRNAALDREAAQQEILNTREEALAHYRKVSALKGAQRARAAANGVGLDFGTAADVLADTDLLAREDVARIYKQGNERTRGFEISASNNRAEASASRQAGTGALISGAFNAGSTILGGAQQYSTIQAGRGGKPLFR
jgi:hypothetical protein